MHAFLDVGSGDRSVPIPAYFEGWRRDRLDIDPIHQPEILLDARQLHTLPPAIYDAVYCAHNLEHFHRHDGVRVVEGFHHILKPEGFLELRVPDLGAMMRHMVERNLDLEDVAYDTAAGPVLFRDLVYGWHRYIEAGNEFQLHRTGFTQRSLIAMVAPLGFPHYSIGPGLKSAFELRVYFFKQVPGPDLQQMISTQAKPDDAIVIIPG